MTGDRDGCADVGGSGGGDGGCTEYENTAALESSTSPLWLHTVSGTSTRPETGGDDDDAVREGRAAMMRTYVGQASGVGLRERMRRAEAGERVGASRCADGIT